MKTKFKILVLALTLGMTTFFVACSKDDDAADSDLCFGLTQEECDRLY